VTTSFLIRVRRVHARRCNPSRSADRTNTTVGKLLGGRGLFSSAPNNATATVTADVRCQRQCLLAQQFGESNGNLTMAGTALDSKGRSRSRACRATRTRPSRSHRIARMDRYRSARPTDSRRPAGTSVRIGTLPVPTATGLDPADHGWAPRPHREPRRGHLQLPQVINAELRAPTRKMNLDTRRGDIFIKRPRARFAFGDRSRLTKIGTRARSPSTTKQERNGSPRQPTSSSSTRPLGASRAAPGVLPHDHQRLRPPRTRSTTSPNVIQVSTSLGARLPATHGAMPQPARGPAATWSRTVI
jgi:hypothetical protein